MNNKIKSLQILTLLFSAESAFGQTLITGNSNSVNITQITYERNGNEIVQNASATSTTSTNDSIFLKNARIDDNGISKDLKFFNIGGTISNLNLTTVADGVGVIKNGVRTGIHNGVPAYEAALTGILNDRDINNYAYYDYADGGFTRPVLPATGVGDFDVQFANPFRAGDYIAVTERDGNTFFNLTALDINGNVIADANVLQFNSSSGSLNVSGNPGGYDWNLGFASENTDRTWYNDQPQWMTIAKAELFGTNTSVYGFRVDNDGGADVKFFGISDTSFVPEPSVVTLLAVGMFGFFMRRNRA